VLWVLGIHFYAPLVLTLLLFAAMLVTAGIAMLPSDELRS
jgi:hypothetical protein